MEKALKTVLTRHGVRYPFTHDTETLVKLANEAGFPLPRDSEKLTYLTPFGALFRYEDEEWGLPPSLDVSDLLVLAERTVTWACDLISEE